MTPSWRERHLTGLAATPLHALLLQILSQPDTEFTAKTLKDYGHQCGLFHEQGLSPHLENIITTLETLHLEGYLAAQSENGTPFYSLPLDQHRRARDLYAQVFDERQCSSCGCCDSWGCEDGCWWAANTRCSQCHPKKMADRPDRCRSVQDEANL